MKCNLTARDLAEASLSRDERYVAASVVSCNLVVLNPKSMRVHVDMPQADPPVEVMTFTAGIESLSLVVKRRSA